MDKRDLQRRNVRIGIKLIILVLVMVGASFASVPLYSLFCQVTGFGGTTQTAEALPHTILNRTIEVRFNADTDPALPWRFKPDTYSMKVKVGAPGLTSFLAENYSKTPITGMAVYNVTPEKAGAYFHKIQCFCFNEQTLAAGQKAHMPVYFFVDPSIADDRNMDDVKTITLSYTFFQSGSSGLDKQPDSYTNKVESPQVN